MSSLFLSCATNEFGSYRATLADDLGRPGLQIEIQEKFLAYGDRTLLMLDEYVQSCDAVIHLTGDQTGSVASAANREAILGRYSYEHLQQKLGLNCETVDSLTYTQWEAWLAVLHGRKLYICTPAGEAPRDSTLSDAMEAERQRQAQLRHLELLRKNGRYAEDPLKFPNASRLSIALLRALNRILPPVTILISTLLPPSLGSLFKGREDWLAQLRDALRPIAENQIDARRVAVWGIGGLGKTRLAVEYAHTFGHDHTALLAVTASTAEDLRATVADLAGCLKLPQAASIDVGVRYKAALEWLDEPAHRGWFLLVDNVDDEASFNEAESLIRRLHYGRVVLTGRMREWPDYVTELHLNLLDNDAASAYLLEATAGKRIVSPRDRDDADQLAGRLDGLALALVQAAGAIRMRSLSFADYLREWDTNHEELIDDPDFNPTITGYPRTVGATWKTSYEQLPPANRVVFDALCWLAPDPIPERLITQSWPEAALDNLPDEIRSGVETGSKRLLQPLYDFCLAEAPVDAQRCFSIHRLVQDVGRIWQRKAGTADDRLLTIVSLVEADFVRDGIENLTLHILPQLRQVAPHALALLAQESGVTPISRCELYRMLSEMRWHEGLNAEAKQHGEQAVLNGYEALNLKNDGDAPALCLARALCNLIFVLSERGDTGDAQDRGKEALDLTLGWETDECFKHREARARALLEKGRVHNKKGEQSAALMLFEESRMISAELCNLEPGNVIHRREMGIAIDYVGRVRDNMGNYEEALQLFEENRKISVDLCQREPDNPAHRRELGIALACVGRVRQTKGQHDEALQLFEESRNIFAELCKLDPDNLAHRRDLGIALANVGNVREKKGEHDEALQLYEESRKIFAELCQREPDNLAHRRDLAFALINVGRVCKDQREALKLFAEGRNVIMDLCEREKDNMAHRRELGIVLLDSGRANKRLGNYPLAISDLEQSSQIFQGLLTTAAFGDTIVILREVENELEPLKKIAESKQRRKLRHRAEKKKKNRK